MNKLALNGFLTACKIITFQFFAVLVLSGLVLVVTDFLSAQSLFVGGVIAILPNFILAVFLFSSSGATQLKQTMSRFYRGVSVKLVLTSIVLAIALKSQAFDVAFLFSGFAVGLVAHIFSPNSFT
ncbi:ATP synthase subunit I [Catenovulum maritimum]|uniref:ATP synthase I n=1 Tax=Catenovulum maritimum TaxID=1513271 RepID=A0A0J8GTA3_9ALTE|nr:ATP synthase subunit I [Catenovulum maritimum]KMT65987.1 hypothetical protein XM47_05910 [Catenovulum maritimum]